MWVWGRVGDKEESWIGWETGRVGVGWETGQGGVVWERGESWIG